MGYLKGQHEAAATVVLALIVIFILLLGFISLKILTLAFLVVLAYNFLLSSRNGGSSINKMISTGIFALVIILILCEFVPEIVDVLATPHMKICGIHYLFPLHFLIDSETLGTCTTKAAVAQKNAAWCGSNWVGYDMKAQCILKSVKAGARDCSGLAQSAFGSFCEKTVAEETEGGTE